MLKVSWPAKSHRTVIRSTRIYSRSSLPSLAENYPSSPSRNFQKPKPTPSTWLNHFTTPLYPLFRPSHLKIKEKQPVVFRTLQPSDKKTGRGERVIFDEEEEIANRQVLLGETLDIIKESSMNAKSNIGKKDRKGGKIPQAKAGQDEPQAVYQKHRQKMIDILRKKTPTDLVALKKLWDDLLASDPNPDTPTRQEHIQIGLSLILTIIHKVLSSPTCPSNKPQISFAISILDYTLPNFEDSSHLLAPNSSLKSPNPLLETCTILVRSVLNIVHVMDSWGSDIAFKESEYVWEPEIALDRITDEAFRAIGKIKDQGVEHDEIDQMLLARALERLCSSSIPQESSNSRLMKERKAAYMNSLCFILSLVSSFGAPIPNTLKESCSIIFWKNEEYGHMTRLWNQFSLDASALDSNLSPSPDSWILPLPYRPSILEILARPSQSNDPSATLDTSLLTKFVNDTMAIIEQFVKISQVLQTVEPILPYMNEQGVSTSWEHSPYTLTVHHQAVWLEALLRPDAPSPTMRFLAKKSYRVFKQNLWASPLWNSSVATHRLLLLLVDSRDREFSRMVIQDFRDCRTRERGLILLDLKVIIRAYSIMGDFDTASELIMTGFQNSAIRKKEDVETLFSVLGEKPESLFKVIDSVFPVHSPVAIPQLQWIYGTAARSLVVASAGNNKIAQKSIKALCEVANKNIEPKALSRILTTINNTLQTNSGPITKYIPEAVIREMRIAFKRRCLDDMVGVYRAAWNGYQNQPPLRDPKTFQVMLVYVYKLVLETLPPPKATDSHRNPPTASIKSSSSKQLKKILEISPSQPIIISPGERQKAVLEKNKDLGMNTVSVKHKIIGTRKRQRVLERLLPILEQHGEIVTKKHLMWMEQLLPFVSDFHHDAFARILQKFQQKLKSNKT